ncbi:MAG: phosphatase PAP2 family protein [Candidatus Dojkabacteria bacterium]|jgi:membrane-associated phospholipid phosphatase
MLKQKIARIISELFNGFLTMILTPVIGICISTLDTFSKLIISLAYLLSTVLPYFVLKASGKISDYELTKREERPVYFTVLSILFGLIFLSTLLLRDIQVQTISLNLFLVSTIMTVITYFWKISGHTIYSTLLFVTLIYIFPDYPYFYLLFLSLPFIGWSRIVLEKHTLSQVIFGSFLTLLISVLNYWPFC